MATDHLDGYVHDILMDNPNKWNITNSAQNIVSALVDPSKQFDVVFKREWTNTFGNFSRHQPSSRTKQDAELKTKLSEYVSKLDNRKHIKAFETQGGFTLSSIPENYEKLAVPDIFLQEEFDLSNLETFKKVVSSGYIDTNSKSDIKKDDSDLDVNFRQGDRDWFTKEQLKTLQQTFADYLDIIEERLASQISNRSGDFFQVMSSVDCVMDELSLAIKSVTNLRKKCFKLNNALILPNMKSIDLNRTRNNAQAVLDKMNEISYLCKVQPMIQILLSASDFVGALELIAKSRDMLHKDLTRVVSLRYLESQLAEIEQMIGSIMQEEFLTLISSEWDGTVNQQSSAASRLSKLFDYFANGYTALPQKGSLTFLSLLQVQAEKFVNQFHEERKKRIESALEIEQWKVVEVPSDFQHLMSCLIDNHMNICDIFIPESQPTQNGGLSRESSELTINDSLVNGQMKYSAQDRANSVSGAKTGTSVGINLNDAPRKQSIKEDSKPTYHLHVGGSTYVIVNSVINLVRTIMDYCKCAHGIRSLSADLLERLFKILLLFNSKTYHLVYSAGAVQVAGLKTITTRSLIVSQRSLKLVTLLIPSIQEHFSKLLPGDNRLRRFNEIKFSYEEHATKIPGRVKSIFKDILNLHLQEWLARPPFPTAQFTAVAQHMMRSHENIQDALPHDGLKLLFFELNQTFKEVLMTHLRRLNITSDDETQRWLVTQDLTFYCITLRKLSAFTGVEVTFDDVWTKLASMDNNQQDNSDHELSKSTDLQ